MHLFHMKKTKLERFILALDPLFTYIIIQQKLIQVISKTCFFLLHTSSAKVEQWLSNLNALWNHQAGLLKHGSLPTSEQKTHRVRVQGWKNIFRTNGNENKAGVDRLISDKTAYQPSSEVCPFLPLSGSEVCLPPAGLLLWPQTGRPLLAHCSQCATPSGFSSLSGCSPSNCLQEHLLLKLLKSPLNNYAFFSSASSDLLENSVFLVSQNISHSNSLGCEISNYVFILCS